LALYRTVSEIRRLIGLWGVYSIEQTSSKHRAGSSRPIGTGSNVGLGLGS